MKKSLFLISFLMFSFLSSNILAEEVEQNTKGQQEQQLSHYLTAWAEVSRSDDDFAGGWGIYGWVGDKVNKLHFKSEAKNLDRYKRESRMQLFYSRAVSQSWEARIGLRHDFRSDFSNREIDYLTLGLAGMAPYSIYTSFQALIGDGGNLKGSLNQAKDFSLTKKLISSPYYEMTFFAQDVPALNVKSGLTEIEVGIVTRYEVNKRVAPYVTLYYDQKTFGTADLARKTGSETHNFVIAVGTKIKL